MLQSATGSAVSRTVSREAVSRKDAPLRARGYSVGADTSDTAVRLPGHAES